MTVQNLAARAVRATVVTLTAATMCVIAAVLAADPSSATTAHRPSRPAVLVRAGRTTATHACPQTTTFTARILSNGPALVHYHWRRSDGAVSAQRTLRFRGRGHHTFPVQTRWTIPSDLSGWEQLVVSRPDRIATRELHFRTHCATQVSVPSVGATDSSALCGDVYTDLSGTIDISGTTPSSLRYYWIVDGTIVDDTTVIDPAALAPGVVAPTFHYAFLASPGTAWHYAVLHAETTDGNSSQMSSTAFFTVTCA